VGKGRNSVGEKRVVTPVPNSETSFVDLTRPEAEGEDLMIRVRRGDEYIYESARHHIQQGESNMRDARQRRIDRAVAIRDAKLGLERPTVELHWVSEVLDGVERLEEQIAHEVPGSEIHDDLVRVVQRRLDVLTGNYEINPIGATVVRQGLAERYTSTVDLRTPASEGISQSIAL
jgi:hypothetical protein